MIVKKETLQAIRKAVNEAGSQVEFSKKTGVHKASVWKYMSGSVKRIEDENWEKLEPFIRKYLPEESQPPPARRDLISKDELIKKILDSPDLDSETKIRVLKIISA
jgi:hypothetical protein